MQSVQSVTPKALSVMKACLGGPKSNGNTDYTDLTDFTDGFSGRRAPCTTSRRTLL
jgi:hypothetical protein